MMSGLVPGVIGKKRWGTAEKLVLLVYTLEMMLCDGQNLITQQKQDAQA